MAFSLSRRKAFQGFLTPGEYGQVFNINVEPGHFFTLRVKSQSISPRITVELETDIIEQSTCYSSQCKTGIIDGERFKNDSLLARVTAMNGSGNYKLKLIDHGDINKIASQVIRATNRNRRRNGLEPLRKNSRLSQAAQAHVDDMDNVGRYLGHLGSDGSDLSDRIDKVGYQWRYIAENAASGQGTAKQVVRSWMNSPGHRANLLSDEVSEIGVGFSSNDETGTPYWIQKFASPA